MATKWVSRGRAILSSPIFRFQISRKPTKVHPPPQALYIIYHNIRSLIWTVSPFIISEYNKNQKINNPPPTWICTLTTKQSFSSQLKIHSWPENQYLWAETRSRAPFFDFRFPENQLNYTPPPQAISLIYHNIRSLIWTVSPFTISEYIKNQKINNPFLPESVDWPQNSHSQAN